MPPSRSTRTAGRRWPSARPIASCSPPRAASASPPALPRAPASSACAALPSLPAAARRCASTETVMETAMIERPSSTQSGFSLVEILVTLVIVMIGLLGLAGVQMRAHQAEMESYQRAQALVLVADMVDR